MFYMFDDDDDDDCESGKPKLSKDKQNLLFAVGHSTLAHVQEVVNLYPNLDKDEESFDYLLLVTALERKHKSISNFLMKKNCRVRVSTKTGSHCSPLYYAVEINDVNIFKELYRRGASLYDTDANEISALEFAVAQGRSALIDCVLKIDLPNADKWEPHCSEDIALFHAACCADNATALIKFISRGFSLNSRSTFKEEKWVGFTPLHFAVEGTARKSTNTLLKYDIDFHAKDKQGRTPLNLAFQIAKDEDRSDLPLALREDKNDLVQAVFKAYFVKGQENFQNILDNTGLSHFHIVSSINFESSDDELNQVNFLRHLIGSNTNINDTVDLNHQHYPAYTALHFAAHYSCFNVLNLLLKNGANIAKSDKFGRTPLHVVAHSYSSFENKRDLRVIETLIKYGAYVNAKDFQGTTPLHHAFFSQIDNETLIQFVRSKIDPAMNCINCHGCSYFHIVCTGVNLEVVEEFLKNGASVQARVTSNDFSGYSALHFAIKFNRANIVEYLLDHGAHANNCDTYCETTPIHLACSNEFSRFWDSTDKNLDDWLVSRTNQIRIVELLIKYGASITAGNRSEESPLLKACILPYPMNLWSSENYQPHQERILNEISVRQKTIVNMLLRHGADPNTHSRRHGHILHVLTEQYRVCSSRKDLAEILLKNGADVNVANESGDTPLCVAVSKHYDTSVIDLYIRYGADVNKTSQSNRFTPLHAAVKEYDTRYPSTETNFIRLIEHPLINLNAQEYSKRTPLHIAIVKGKVFCIQKLLDFGADINVEDANRMPPVACLWLQSAPSFANSNSPVKIVVTHVKKLMGLGLFVTGKVREYSEKLFKSPELDDPTLDTDIDAELDLLKASKIDRYTSLYDILLKHPNDVAKYVKNTRFEEIVSCSQSTIEFPLYQNLLVLQYKKGLIRRSSLDRAKEALRLLSGVDWPDLCSELILNHLNNKNLNNLIESGLIKKSQRKSDDSSLREKGSDEHSQLKRSKVDL